MFAWARKASFLAIVLMAAALHLTLRRCLLPMLNICAEGAREARWAVLAEAKGLSGDGRACGAGGRLATTLRRVWRRRQGQAQMRVALLAWVAAAARTRTPARSSAQVVARALDARPMCIAAGGSGFTRRGAGVHVGKSLYELPRTSGRLGWRARAAKLSKLSPAWASRPGVRRAAALSTVLIRAWPRRGGVSYASRRAPLWSSVLRVAVIRRMQVLHDRMPRLLRVMCRRGRLAQRLQGLWAPPLRLVRLLALFAQRHCEGPHHRCVRAAVL